jgi:hypothetical protein
VLGGRQARRIQAGEMDGRCRHCLYPARPFAPTEDDRSYWLEPYGVTRNGVSAADHVRSHGLPPELAEITDALFGSRE